MTRMTHWFGIFIVKLTFWGVGSSQLHSILARQMLLCPIHLLFLSDNSTICNCHVMTAIAVNCMQV